MPSTWGFIGFRHALVTFRDVFVTFRALLPCVVGGIRCHGAPPPGARHPGDPDPSRSNLPPAAGHGRCRRRARPAGGDRRAGAEPCRDRAATERGARSEWPDRPPGRRARGAGRAGPSGHHHARDQRGHPAGRARRGRTCAGRGRGRGRHGRGERGHGAGSHRRAQPPDRRPRGGGLRQSGVGQRPRRVQSRHHLRHDGEAGAGRHLLRRGRRRPRPARAGARRSRRRAGQQGGGGRDRRDDRASTPNPPSTRS